jgi:hypothetical protein
MERQHTSASPRVGPRSGPAASGQTTSRRIALARKTGRSASRLSRSFSPFRESAEADIPSAKIPGRKSSYTVKISAPSTGRRSQASARIRLAPTAKVPPSAKRSLMRCCTVILNTARGRSSRAPALHPAAATLHSPLTGCSAPRPRRLPPDPSALRRPRRSLRQRHR